MKYSIHGFFQPRAVELGLTNDDLLVLRWFVDFAGTDKMKKIIEPDGIYYWVNYSTILNDLPVLGITKDRLRRKHFKKLCDCGILKHKHIKQGGSFSYYAYGFNYATLIYLQENPTPIPAEGTSNLPQGCDKNNEEGTSNLPQGCGENTATKINLLNNSSINNQSTNDINVPYEKIKDLFHDICISYPKLVKVSDNRKTSIAARFKEYDCDIEVFKTLFTKAEQSDFLKGKNDRNWKANFDWLMNQSNMAKVLEDTYKNKEVTNGSSTKQPNQQSRSKYAQFS